MQLLEKNKISGPTRWNVVSIGRGGGSTVDRMVGFPLGCIFILSGWRRIDTDVWTTQDNSSYHNNVKMRVDAWKNQGAKVFTNCKAIVANSIFFSKLATMANGSWSPAYRSGSRTCLHRCYVERFQLQLHNYRSKRHGTHQKARSVTGFCS